MSKNIEEIMANLTDLPTLPQVATRIVTMVEDPGTGSQEINEVVGKDPALAGKILRLVNSSYYGLMHKVSSLNQGIVILGFDIIKSIVLCASVFEIFKDQKDEPYFDKQLFWKNSVCVGAVSKSISQIKDIEVEAGTAFSLGLLHGIGKLVIDICSPETMKEIITIAEKDKCNFYEAQKKIDYPTYTDFGAFLAEKWQLSEEMVNAIRDQENLKNAENKKISATLNFAKYICSVKGIKASGECEDPTLDAEVWETLGFKKKDVPQVLTDVNDEIMRAAAFIDDLVGE